MSARFLVVEDHPLFRDAIRATLASLCLDNEVETFDNLGEALGRFDTARDFQLAVIDLDLTDSNGLDSLRAVLARRPDCHVVVFSAYVDPATIQRCLQLGARGYIPKTMSSEAVVHALRLVQAGDIFVPQQALTGSELAARRPYGTCSESIGTDPRTLGLTDRQISVLQLMLEGLPNKLICRRLNLAEGTIKVHVSAVLRALGVHNRTQAILAATQRGLRFDGIEREARALSEPAPTRYVN